MISSIINANNQLIRLNNQNISIFQTVELFKVWEKTKIINLSK